MYICQKPWHTKLGCHLDSDLGSTCLVRDDGDARWKVHHGGSGWLGDSYGGTAGHSDLCMLYSLYNVVHHVKL